MTETKINSSAPPEHEGITLDLFYALKKYLGICNEGPQRTVAEMKDHVKKLDAQIAVVESHIATLKQSVPNDATQETILEDAWERVREFEENAPGDRIDRFRALLHGTLGK